MKKTLALAFKISFFILIAGIAAYHFRTKTIFLKAAGFIFFNSEPLGGVTITIHKPYDLKENLNFFSKPDTGNYFLNFNAEEQVPIHLEYSKKEFTTLRISYTPVELPPIEVAKIDTQYLLQMPIPLSNNKGMPTKLQSLINGSAVMQIYDENKFLYDTIHLNNIHYFTSITPKESFVSTKKSTSVSKDARWYKISLQPKSKKEKKSGWILYDPSSVARP